MKPTRMNQLNWSRSVGIALTATLVIVCCPAAQAVDWLNNATSNDWNDPTNWQGGALPNDNAAGVFSATGNIATISSNVTATPAEIIIGGFGNTGRLDHVAGTLNTHNAGWPPGWMLVGLGDTGNATYNLANTATIGEGALTGYGTGSGTLNLADALFMGEPNGSNAGTGISTINVNTTGALNVTYGMFIGVSGWTANVNVDAGTVHANDIYVAKIQNGNATAAAGNLNISGGSVLANYRMNLADGGANNSAIVNQNGGAVSLGSAADWAGLSIASATGDGNGGTATYNLNGGTLSTRYVTSENWHNDDNTITHTKGTSTFNFNGGTLKALDNRDVPWAQLIGGDNAITHAYVKAGGAVIDTNGFNVLVGQDLEGDIVSTGGGLTKNGEGTLTLSGANTYTGNTKVNQGTLTINSAYLADSADVTIAAGATLILNHGDTDTIRSLIVGVTPVASGLYRASDDNGGSDPGTPLASLSGAGKLQVTGAAVPGYGGWAASHVGGAASNQDTDQDGVANGVEYFMNAAAGFTANPSVVVTGAVRTVTWTNGGNIPSTDYAVQFVVQTSADLVNWTPVNSGDPNLSNTSGSVTYTITGTGKQFVRLKVTPN